MKYENHGVTIDTESKVTGSISNANGKFEIILDGEVLSRIEKFVLELKSNPSESVIYFWRSDSQGKGTQAICGNNHDITLNLTSSGGYKIMGSLSSPVIYYGENQPGRIQRVVLTIENKNPLGSKLIMNIPDKS